MDVVLDNTDLQILERMQANARISNADLARELNMAPSAVLERVKKLEQWLENEPEHNFSYYCGLQKEQFPPVEKLTTEQMEQVSLAFEKLLFTWNIGVEIPEKLPAAQKYNLLISVLERKVAIVENGFETVEFCSYDPPSCPFNEWCTCKELGLKDHYDDDVEEDGC